MAQPPLPIAAFDEILNSTLQEFLTLSAELGPPVEEGAILVEQAFRRCADLILFGLYNDAPPNRSEFFNRHPLNAAIQAVVAFFEQHRAGDFKDHLQCLSSSILALNWIAAERNPCTTVTDMTDAGEYFGNRVMRIREHRNWINKWNQVLRELNNYVKSHFLTGFTWGALRANQANRDAAAPPPPPPPPADPIIPTEVGQGDRLRRQELLNELNQGTDITRRLRPSGSRPARGINTAPPRGGQVPRVQATVRAVKPPKCELEGRKWIVENQHNVEGLKIDNQSMSESLSMYQCENSSLEVLNKINSVVIDNCSRTNIMLHGVVGSVSLVRCSRINIQFEGVVPLVNVDNSHSIQMFVNESSRGVVVISSQSTALNVCLLMNEGDYVELPVPEQIRTEIRGEQLHSTVYENCG